MAKNDSSAKLCGQSLSHIEKRWQGYHWLPLVYILADYFSVVAAEYAALWLRSFILPVGAPVIEIPATYTLVILPAVFLVSLRLSASYKRAVPFWKMARSVFQAILYAILLITLVLYFGKSGSDVSRLYVGLVWVSSYCFIIGVRYILKRFLNGGNLLQIPVIFMGAGKTAKLVLKGLTSDTGYGYHVVGFIDDNPKEKELVKQFGLLGGFADTERIIKETGVQHIIITAPGLDPSKLVEIINRIQPIVRHISFVPDLIGAPVGNLEVESLFNEKIMVLKVRNNLAYFWNRVLKRAFDLVVSLVGTVAIMPLLLLLALLVFLDDPGPVIFAHRRIGRRGKSFPCYKFRTMCVDAEEKLKQYLAENPEARAEWEESYKLKDDPRITRIGGFLRRTSLDELPQLINVIKGEMSLVGPRPIVSGEIPKYGECFHDFCLVPPGITGMWQVNGRSDTTYEERVSMDSWYVRNWSVWIDIIYLVKTIMVVIKGKGAY